MDIIEHLGDWRGTYARWRKSDDARKDEVGTYPWVTNTRAPFTPARRSLPMLNLALISSAGAYIDGTEPFDMEAADGDLTFREIPQEIEAEDLLFCARGYDPASVHSDLNAQIPLTRLQEFERNGVLGRLNPVWWSFCGFVPDARQMVEVLAANMARRIKENEVQAALLIPASRLCHQSMGLLARVLESEGIPTMTLAVDREVANNVKAPRTAFYKGQLGAVAGLPDAGEYQRRVLDEALRLIEPMDQPTLRPLSVVLETEVEVARGER
jgi:D-proline reductase (dithiol) PrdB